MRRVGVKFAFVAVVALLMVGICRPAAAQEAQSELPAGVTAEDMAAWQKAATPGPEHEMLAAMAGSWTFKSTFRMAPDAPAMESSGTAERKMIFGGRVLVEKAKSEWQGETFEGMGMTGFDNVAAAYWGTWVDSMGTGIMVSSGTCSGSFCEFTGTYNDPMTGAPKTIRMTMNAEADREVHKMYEQGPAGEFESAEVVYTRVK